MFLRSSILTIIFALFNWALSSGDVPQHYLKHFTTNDGLPSSQVYEALQDRDGYMWFATDRGVVRYNGYEFKTFGTKDGLIDNVVFKFFQDHKKRIWMISNSGRLFIYSEGKITPYRFNNKIKDLIKGSFQTSIFVDSSENVYIGSTFGLYMINSTGLLTQRYKFHATGIYPLILIDEKVNFRPANGFGSGISKGQVLDLLHMSQSETYKIKCTSTSFGRLTTLRLKNDRLIFSIGTSIYELKNKKINQIANVPYGIVQLVECPDQKIWACTMNGLYLLSNSDEIKVIRSYLENVYVSNIAKDREGAYWVTTINDGVYYLNNNSIQHYFLDTPLQIPQALTQDKSHIYAGYFPPGISKLNTAELYFFKQPFKNEYITSFFYDSSNSYLYIGNGRIGYFKNETFTKFPIIKHSVANIGFTKNKTGLYSGCQRSLLKIYNDTTEEIAKIDTKLICIYSDQDDNLIVGCLDGAYKFEYTKRKFFPITDQLKDTRVDDIDSYNGNLCFATVGKGLIMLLKDNSVLNIDESHGLCSNTIRKITIDKNKIWCASNNGISEIEIIDPEKSLYNIKNIRINDGLIDNEINDIAFLNDTVWVASKKGISFFNSRTDFTNYSRPNVIFTRFLVSNRDTIIRENYVFPYSENTFSIGFESPLFKSLGKQKYEYLLYNEEDSIKGITTNREVEFLSLDPGKYTLSVKAMNNSGLWSERPATMSFTILSPWWKTFWFRLFIFSLLLSVVYLWYKRRIDSVKEKFEIEKKQASLQLTAMRAQMNPHFIFNVMSSIRNYMQENDVNSAEKYLTSFAKLVRYTLDNSSIQEVSLEEELQALKSYAFLEMQRFENGFDFEIVFDDEIDPEEILVPSLLLQPFVENAIKHGIDRLVNRGKILISVKSKDDSVVISIEDNGIGREDSTNWNSENREKHTSFGSRLTFERIEAFNKAYNKDIRAKIIDLKDKNGLSKGTKVEIEL